MIFGIQIGHFSFGTSSIFNRESVICLIDNSSKFNLLLEKNRAQNMIPCSYIWHTSFVTVRKHEAKEAREKRGRINQQNMGKQIECCDRL